MQQPDIFSILGDEAESLLNHRCQKVPRERVQTPSIEAAQHTFARSDRSKAVQHSLMSMYHHGALAGTGYLSIFPVDQALEHTAGYSFYTNPSLFDPENIIKLAIAGGCSAVASSYGALALVSGQYASEIPFIVKLNHSEHLTLPEKTNQILFATAAQAYQLGAKGVGATIYFGSPESHRQITEIASQFAAAHQLGMFTVLWCYPRNDQYTKDGSNHERSVDITSQAIHIGATLGADIVKQKLPSAARGFEELGFSKYTPEMYDALLTDHPIDLVRYQVLHSYAGKIPLINSGGESGENDIRDAVCTAVINKRAGGSGLIMGRKVFKKSWDEGLAILRLVQAVYLDQSITIA